MIQLKLKSALPIVFLCIAGISFLLVLKFWMDHYVPEAFFDMAFPFAVICAGALIAAAISSRHIPEDESEKE